MTEIKFGTDGWRAVIADQFTFSNIKKVTQGIANYVKNRNLLKKGIVIGYDNRFLSEKFAVESARVLLGNGIKSFMFSRPAPTPVIAFAIRQLEAGGAVMITAGHSAPEYNGVKFIPEYAGPALPETTGAIEEEIRRVMDGGKIYELEVEEARALELFEEIDVDGDYIGHLLKMVQTEAFAAHPLKVVVNPMYGCGIGYLDKILTELGCEVKTINNYRDTLFGGVIPEPEEAFLSDLKRAVLTYKADMGLALDGDADRFGLIDAQGEYLHPNRFACLLFDHLIRTRNFRGPVCRSVATSHLLDRVARQNGLTVVETPVGFEYIGQCMREKGCIMGVEENGGLTIFGHVSERDGIMAGLLAVEMMAVSGKSLRELSDGFKLKYGDAYSEKTDVKMSRSEEQDMKAKLEEYRPRSLAGVKVEQLDDGQDGRRILLEDGSWVMVCPQASSLRLYVEAGNADLAQEIKKEIVCGLNLR